jgi:Uma2 family endonuclease
MTGHQHADDARQVKRKLTYADFVRFPDDGRRHELIDGEHYVTPSPNIRHQDLSVRLTVALGKYLEEHPAGRLFHAPLDCVFTNFDIVEPDLLWIAPDQLGIVTDKHVRGAPALVVEILSTSTRRVDLGIKLDLYDRVGVREYWLIDPNTNQIAVYARSGASLAPKHNLGVSDALTSPMLPGFQLNLADYFR